MRPVSTPLIYATAGGALRDMLRSPRFWLAAAGGAVLALLVLGLPTAIIPNPVFGRTVPTRPSDVAIWLASAPLIGVMLATYVARPHRSGHGDAGELRLGVGSVAVFLAIGCPVCNKIVLLALGTSGALTVFAPIQPWIGIVSLAFLAGTLAYRLRQVGRGCERCAVSAGPVAALGRTRS